MTPAPQLDLDAASRAALEFDELLRLVAQQAHTDPGRDQVLALTPLADSQRIRDEHTRCSELRLRLVRDGVLLAGGLPDPRQPAAGLEVEEYPLEPRALRDLALSLQALERTRTGLHGAAECPLLSAWALTLPSLRAETGPILRSIEPDGTVADSASAALAELRSRRTRLSGKLRSRLESMLREPGAARTIRDEFVTQRNGRFVIPVRSDAPRPVQGIVHATSSSGATRFVEPLESVEWNNELVALDEQEREEIRRIAQTWTRSLRVRRNEVRFALRELAWLDGLQARARFAEASGAVAAHVDDGNVLRVKALRHPLLERHLRESGGVCVPLDLELDPADRVLVVSGPNTGGKTVALKSLGLAVLMAQSGIPVTAAEVRIPTFRQLRADVGDHQSIVADLSTFSAHLFALGAVLKDCRPPGLYLFDEIGSGTDPAEGVALAQAVLEALAGAGVTAIATTHQNALKQWAFGDPRAASAAMEFDATSLRPTFRILPGLIGSSAGLEIAARCGLPTGLILRARELLGEESGRTEAFMKRLRDELSSVEQDRRTLDRQREEFAAAKRGAEEALARNEATQRADADRALERLLVAFRKQVRQSLDAIVDEGARVRAVKVAQRAERQLKVEQRKLAQSVHTTDRMERPDTLQVGMQVFIASLGKQGTILRVGDKRVDVQLGRIGIQVEPGDLRLAPLTEPSTAGVSAARPRHLSRDLESGPSAELMLVGKRVEQALDELDRFLDRSLLQGRREVRLVHGHGTGRLKRAVREHLRQHAEVADWRAGENNEGGDGATIAILR